MIAVKTDKEKYISGENIEITGHVTPVKTGQSALLQVFGPGGELARIEPVEVAADGHYSYFFRSGGRLMEADGAYTVTVKYAGDTAKTTISFSAKAIGDKVVIIAGRPPGSLGYGHSSFEPSQLSLTSGNTITFLNQDNTLHNIVSGEVTSLTPDGKFDTGFIPSGKSSTITIRESGQITYFCRLHPNETGVFVAAPTGEAKRVAIRENVKISDSVSVSITRAATDDDRVSRFIAANRMGAKLERHFGPDVIPSIDFDTLAKIRGRKLTIVFWDISNFTSLCEILKANPESVNSFLADYYEQATRVIFTHDGSLDKFMGDGAMAIFGVMGKDESGQVDARSAVNAALDFKIQFEKLTKKWLPIWERLVPEHIDIGLKCGMHTGDVMYGNFGTSQNDQFTAIGAAVNIANRLADEAREGQIVISNTTKLIIGDGYDIKFLRRASLKNIGRELDIFNVNGADSGFPINV